MKKSFIIISICVGLLFAGCAQQKTWVYTPTPYAAGSDVMFKGKAVVLPFEDLRANENNNLIGLYLIPLMPFGWADFSAPEGAQMHVTSAMWVNYKPTEDYPKALAQELQNRRLFQEAFFDFKKGDSDVIIRGQIINTNYNGKVISYGLSFFAPYLWFICFPAAYVENDLELNLSCIDAKSEKVVFTKSYKAPTYSAVSIVYNISSDFNYAEMLKGVYAQFANDIKANPAALTVK